MLAMLTAPQSVDDFFDRIYGRTFQVFHGEAYRFRHLFSWEALDAILRHHRLDSPRLRVFQSGELVPYSYYTDEVRLHRGSSVRRLRASSLMSLIRDGITLSLDNIEELSDPVLDLAAGLERALKEHVQVNAYASWGSERGIDLHWDDHDVFAFQITGCKRWQITRPTRQWPLRRDVAPCPTPDDAPVTEIVLTPGDVLYVPRGWWHVTAAESTSLHLTAGFSPRTGIDLLEWLVDQFRDADLCRQDLPRFANARTQTAHVGRIRERVLNALDAPDTLERYFAEQDGLESARQGFGLSSMPDILSNPPGDSIVTTLVSRARLTPTDEEAVLLANGEKWRLSAFAIPMVRKLLDTSPVTLTELYTTVPEGPGNQESALELIKELVRRGVVMLTPPQNPDST